MVSRLRIFGVATATLTALAGVAGYAGTLANGHRAAWRLDYVRPATIPFPETNPYSPAKAELGRKLFFDPILSGDGSRACVTCHRADLAWADGRARASTRMGGDMALHTPTLLNVAWQDGPLGWDGKFPVLEKVARAPISAPGNMNLKMPDAVSRLSADESYREGFAAAFGDPAVSEDRLEAALATYQRLIVAGKAPFDRWIEGDEGAISEAAKRGFDVFNGKGGCAGCHSGWSFTDNSFHDIGTATGNDLGRGRLMPRSVALQYAFKTPTLREIDQRTAYMHDGSLPTLSAVIDHYDKGGIDRPSRSRQIKPLSLSAREKADLLAFLATLSTESDRDETAAVFPASAPSP